MAGGHDAGAMAEMGDIHELFANHDRITRTVTNLPNGIRTVTESDDPRIAAAAQRSRDQLGQRVEAGNDPGLPIESQALRTIYATTTRSAPRLNRRRRASSSFRRRPIRRPSPHSSSTPRK